MAISNNNVALKSVRQRNYLARDFDGFRLALLDYARQYYPTRIQDFSESSVGGLFLDMAAYVGDNLSFYLDHMYGELNGDTVVETVNKEKALRSAGVPITGASPALVTIDLYIEVPVLSDGSLKPDNTLLPTVKSNSIFRSDSGVSFTLLEDVHFWKIDPVTGATVINPAVEAVNGRRVAGNIVTKILKASGLCSSGDQASDSFNIGEFVPFRRLDISKPNVTQIISVNDDLGNVYYEVNNLTHDVVYKNVLNTTTDIALVKDTLTVIPAPYRFVKEVSLSTRKATLIFGGGTADNLEDDIIPDPSEFSIPLPYSQIFSRVPVNPQKMLQTATLGVAATNTTLTVNYRHGGGLSHNVPAESIRNIAIASLVFPENPSPGLQAQIRNSLAATNPQPAAGGEDALTADELLALIPTVKHAQERIVTKEDLLSRVYTMPSNFGRVYRASIGKNPSNPLAARLYIISRDINSNLAPSPDSLKLNLKRYLSGYRMVSDAIDVLDAGIINLELYFQVVLDPSLNKSVILQNIISDLKNQFSVSKFQIGQPIIVSDVISTIFARTGVISVDQVRFNNLYGTVKNLDYSPIPFDVQLNTKNQIIYPPEGTIFEIKYPDINIVGKALSNV